jgi:hypothetical protein
MTYKGFLIDSGKKREGSISKPNLKYKTRNDILSSLNQFKQPARGKMRVRLRRTYHTTLVLTYIKSLHGVKQLARGKNEMFG